MPGARNIRIGTRIYIPLILAADSEAPLNEGCGGLLAANLLPRSLRIVRHIYVCVVHCELMFIVHPVVMRDLPPPPLSTRTSPSKGKAREVPPITSEVPSPRSNPPYELRASRRIATKPASKGTEDVAPTSSEIPVVHVNEASPPTALRGHSEGKPPAVAFGLVRHS